MSHFTNTSGGTFTFPNGGPTVRRVGYGTMQLPGEGVFGPPRDEAAALAVLREARAAGVNHFDTAAFYGPGVSNRLLREALAPYDDDLTIVTKVGATRGDDKSWKLARSYDDLGRDVEANLEQLGVDRLGVVNLRLGGTMGPEAGSVAEPLRAMIDLKDRGLLRHIGLSNVTPEQYEEAARMTEIACVQNHYNLAHREDDDLIDRLAGRGIAYVPFFPLGGFNPVQAKALDDAAATLGVPKMQVALAWLLRRSPNVLLIPGTSSVEHLRDNLAAADLDLPPGVMASLDRIGCD